MDTARDAEAAANAATNQGATAAFLAEHEAATAPEPTPPQRDAHVGMHVDTDATHPTSGQCASRTRARARPDTHASSCDATDRPSRSPHRRPLMSPTDGDDRSALSRETPHPTLTSLRQLPTVPRCAGLTRDGKTLRREHATA